MASSNLPHLAYMSTIEFPTWTWLLSQWPGMGLLTKFQSTIFAAMLNKAENGNCLLSNIVNCNSLKFSSILCVVRLMHSMRFSHCKKHHTPLTPVTVPVEINQSIPQSLGLMIYHLCKCQRPKPRQKVKSEVASQWSLIACSLKPSFAYRVINVLKLIEFLYMTFT